MITSTINLGRQLQKNILRHHIGVSSGYYKAPAGIYVSVLKRFMDIICSLGLIITVLSWLTPILFIAIKLGSRGPLFFIQQRIGLNGKIFNCLKFRTMYVDSKEQNRPLDDISQRVTGIGLFLRQSHIDELPQLFNVLFGTMSLVGPRPHMIGDHQSFSELVDAYPMRHLVKPGITGLAQAYGFHGNTPDYFSIAHRTKLDLFYIRKLSFLLDVRILLRTCLTSFKFMINMFYNGNKSK